MLQRRQQQWVLDDQNSKNGIRVNGKAVASIALSQPQWLQLGDIYLECEPVSVAAAQRLRQHERQRRHDSQVLESTFQAEGDQDQLVQQGLRNLLALADCARGFVLLRAEGELQIHACDGLHPQELASGQFHGSIGAVQRALQGGHSVICHDTWTTGWLRYRESIVAGGIRALLSLPLLADGQAIGAAYVDSQSPGRYFTELDVELIEAFAARMATVIDAARIRDGIDHVHAQLNSADLSARLAWSDVTSRHRRCGEA